MLKRKNKDISIQTGILIIEVTEVIYLEGWGKKIQAGDLKGQYILTDFFLHDWTSSDYK